jgi:hypothetical protein
VIIEVTHMPETNTPEGTSSSEAATTAGGAPPAAKKTAARETSEDAGSILSNLQGITIDIPGVEAATKIADLTVAQFVSLMDQISRQLNQVSGQLSRRSAQPVDIDATIQHIREIMNGEDAGSDDLRAAVRAAQNAILDNTPTLIRSAQARVVQQSQQPRDADK